MPKENRCQICYQELSEFTSEYHPACAKDLFGSSKSPKLGFDLNDIEKLAREECLKRISIPGVQPKLSLELTSAKDFPRLTIVSLWGQYIFKPPFSTYPYLPEVEDLCMRLAEACGIETAKHGLIQFANGEFGYICKRFDRLEEHKLAVEDMCQLSETMTENKYYGSLEKVGKIVKKHTTNSGLELQKLFEVVLFSFLIGNSDMHLKNFSLLSESDKEIRLSPAYDLVSTALMLPSDKEESALSINGKKHQLQLEDFTALGNFYGILPTVQQHILDKLRESSQVFGGWIEKSFLPQNLRHKLQSVIERRMKILFA